MEGQGGIIPKEGGIDVPTLRPREREVRSIWATR